MSNLILYSFKILYFFLIFFIIISFSKIKSNELDLPLKLDLQLKYDLNNNLTDFVLQDLNNENKNFKEPIDILFNILRVQFQRLLNNYDKSKYKDASINESCIDYLQSIFGNETEEISNFYYLKLLSDSSKNKNDLGLYAQCYKKSYRFIKEDTQYFIVIIDKSDESIKNSSSFDEQIYFLGLCIPKNDDCNVKELSAMFYFTVLNINNVLDLKDKKNINGILLNEKSKDFELKDFLKIIPFVILLIYILIVFFTYQFFFSFSENKERRQSIGKKFANKEIKECFNWKENLSELLNFKLTYTKINNYSGLTYIKGIRGISMLHLILGFTFFALFNSPFRLLGKSSLSNLFNSYIYPIFTIGIKFCPSILFSCSGYCLNYKLMCYFDNKSDKHMKLIPFILYQSHKYFMLIFVILFCKFSLFTLFKKFDNPVWFFFGEYFCDKPSIWKMFLSFLFIPSFSFDSSSRIEQNIFDYLWIVNNEIIFFLIGTFIIFFCYKFKFRNDKFLIFLTLIIYVFKIIFCLFLGDFYPTIFYYFFDYGKLMIFNLSYFLIGMFFGSINFTIQKGIVVSNINESNEIKNKPYLIIPCKIVNYYKSCGNYLISFYVFFQIIIAIFISCSIYIFIDEEPDKMINNSFLNKFLIFDNEIYVIIIHSIALIFYIKGLNLINDFLSNNFWLMLNKFYFTYILIINVIILYVIYMSDARILFSDINIILYSLVCGTFLIIFSIYIYAFIELPFKKMLKILIQRWQYKEEIIEKKDDDEDDDSDSDVD